MKKIYLSFLLFLVSLGVYAAPPRVALVLSGGGAKGYVHIATLEMLEKYGIPVDYVVGTSMGALVGGLYSVGYNSKDIIEIIRSTDVENSVFNLDTGSLVPSPYSANAKENFSMGFDKNGITSLTGIVDDTKILNLLSSLVVKESSVNNFDELKKPFRAVAVDFYSGDVVPLKSGSLTEALRASMSIPIAFPIFKVGDRYLVDGGVKENIPLETAISEFNPDIIIVSDCTGVRFRSAAGSDILTKLNDSTIGIADTITQSVALGGVITLDKHQNIRDSVDLLVEYDTSSYGTSSFASFESILSTARTNAMLLEDKFASLSKKIEEEGREAENVDLKNESYYSLLPYPSVKSVVITGDEKYRPHLNNVLYDVFKEFENTTLDEENLKKLEAKINSTENFFKMAYIYFVVNKKEDDSLELEIKYNLYPVRKHNLILDTDIMASLNMINSQKMQGNPAGVSGTQFGFSFYPYVDLSYRNVVSPETSLNNVGVRFQTSLLFKDNRLTIDYEHIFTPGTSYVWYINPSIGAYAGYSSLLSISANTSWFSGYDYGLNASLSTGYYNKLSTFKLSCTLDYLYFGSYHDMFTGCSRRNMMNVNFSLDYVLGRKEYKSLSLSTGYRVEVEGWAGFDLGQSLMGESYLQSTAYPYSVRVRTDGTIKVLPHFSIMFNAECGVSRRASDLALSYFTYGGVKGMPGFSIADNVFDYYNVGVNLLVPFTTNNAFYPLFIIRAAIGGYDGYSSDIYSLTNAEPYDIYKGNYVPFSNMNKINIGLGAFFAFHTPFLDIIIGAGYEFREQRVSINIELW